MKSKEINYGNKFDEFMDKSLTENLYLYNEERGKFEDRYNSIAFDPSNIETLHSSDTFGELWRKSNKP
jgi:hypothetical protein